MAGQVDPRDTLQPIRQLTSLIMQATPNKANDVIKVFPVKNQSQWTPKPRQNSEKPTTNQNLVKGHTLWRK